MDMTRLKTDGAERTSPPPAVDLNAILGTDGYRPRMTDPSPNLDERLMLAFPQYFARLGC